MKWVLGALWLVLLVGPVLGQVNDPGDEDFESFSVGEVPSADWYSFSMTGAGDSNVQAIGADGSTNGFRHNPTGAGSSIFELTSFDICSEEINEISFWFRTSGAPSSGLRYVWRFEIVGAVESGDSLGRQFGVAIGPGDNDLTLNIGPDFFDTGASVSSDTYYEVIFSDLDCVGGSVRMEVPALGVDVFETSSEMAKGPTSMLRLFNQGDSPDMFLDEWVIDVFVPGEPAEFDSGLVAALESLGFRSAESQMFFTLILVGVVQVAAGSASKVVASGRFKNYLVMGLGALVAMFAVFIEFLDVWEWIVAFMLGVFAVRGVHEARNTFAEIRGRVSELVSGAEPDAAVSEAEMGLVAAPSDFAVNDAVEEESGAEAAVEPDGDAVEDEEVDS